MLEKLFKSKTTVRLLNLLIFSPPLHLREIARRAAVSPSETKKELDILLSLGLITEKKTGQQKLFAKNNESLIIGEISSIFRKMDGVTLELRKVLKSEPKVRYAFIFGSFV